MVGGADDKFFFPSPCYFFVVVLSVFCGADFPPLFTPVNWH